MWVDQCWHSWQLLCCVISVAEVLCDGRCGGVVHLSCAPAALLVIVQWRCLACGVLEVPCLAGHVALLAPCPAPAAHAATLTAGLLGLLVAPSSVPCL